MSAPALQINQLCKVYDNSKVVDNIDLTIEEGEIFGLLGPNGAGKSTTINMTTGATKISSGQIKVFGHDVIKDYKLTRAITGVMHQEFIADPFFKIGPALKLHSGYYGMPDDPKWRKILIDRLDLGPHLDKKFIMLSGGMKRRVMIAKALIHKPKLLILDEPTAGVDVELRRALWEFVREINNDGTTVLLTTHYLEEAEQMCERVAIMNFGKIIINDSVAQLVSTLNQKLIVLTLKDSIEVVPEELSDFSVTLAENHHDLIFQISSKDEINNLLKKLVAIGHDIVDIKTKNQDLEDIFVELVHK